MMRHIISVILENETGALSRVVGLFSQRGYNIDSLTVAPTQEASLSRITIQIISNHNTLEQIKKQLNKLIDVVRVNELKNTFIIEKEIMLIKIKVDNFKREEINHVIKVFCGKIVDIKLNFYIIQIIGSNKKLNNFINTINDIVKIVEIVRSGIITMSKLER